MASPAKGLSLSWKDVGFTVEVKVDKKPATKQILQGVTGAVRPGEMLCIMGTSGSGKTSMLNVLSGRHLKGGEVTGEVLVNGAKRGSTWNKQTAYVEQDDLMFAHLTVLETLTYTARLRCPGSMSRAQKEARAKEVIQQLGLSECQDTRIGDAMTKGISGGERKRASIGMELIAGPAIIFLDEPTSGLDSFTAFELMKLIKTLAASGKSVLCSIHQPRAKIFNLFDKTLLLTQGKTTYYGARGNILRFFESVGHSCPEDDNFADFLLDVTTVDFRTAAARAESGAVVDTLRRAYTASEF